MSDEKKPKAPELGTGKDNSDTDWVFYLQQMLNFKYQMQVVEEDGRWGAVTSNAVAHFRQHYGLGTDDVVDAATWKELGHEEKQVESVDKSATLVQATDSDLCWAAAIATLLSSKGGEHTVDKVCEDSGLGKAKHGFLEIQHLSTEKIKFTLAETAVGDAASWSSALKSHGPLLMPVNGEYHMVVVSGIRPKDDAVEIHVLDPIANKSDWLEFEQAFLVHYNISVDAEIELLAAG